jgi:DNA-binding CsgD family transcriptional regulator
MDFFTKSYFSSLKILFLSNPYLFDVKSRTIIPMARLTPSEVATIETLGGKMKPIEIARLVGASRQSVNYYLAKKKDGASQQASVPRSTTTGTRSAEQANGTSNPV